MVNILIQLRTLAIRLIDAYQLILVVYFNVLVTRCLSIEIRRDFISNL